MQEKLIAVTLCACSQPHLWSIQQPRCFSLQISTSDSSFHQLWCAPLWAPILTQMLAPPLIDFSGSPFVHLSPRDTPSIVLFSEPSSQHCTQWLLIWNKVESNILSWLELIRSFLFDLSPSCNGRAHISYRGTLLYLCHRVPCDFCSFCMECSFFIFFFKVFLAYGFLYLS